MAHVFDRREFLNRSALLAAVASGGVAATTAPARAAGKSANERLRVAVVGVRNRGVDHIKGFAGKNNCEVAVICDCDEAVVARGMKTASEAQQSLPKYVQDVRKVLDDKSIDIISIATPNHWHALMAVWAMRAGKDVYCEKPATHNIREGRLMIQAAQKFGRICQVGTQSRSNPGMREAIAHIHSGKIGPVSLAYGTCYKRRKSIGPAVQTDPPTSLNYDLWAGPAAAVPPRRNGEFGPVHYDWHWFWDYGNGDFGNQGVHEADKARWGLKADALPKTVQSLGGRFGYTDAGETPNTQLSLYDFGSAQMLFEVRGLETEALRGSKVGNIWFGETGTVVCPSYSSGAAFDHNGKKVAEFKGGTDQHHYDNFVAAVRSQKPSDLNCEVREGHLSAALCHLANISYRLGTPAAIRDMAFDNATNATEALDRMRSHLSKNGVPPDDRGQLGPVLTIDPDSETITNAGPADLKKAQDLLFREYRSGFDITEAI